VCKFNTAKTIPPHRNVAKENQLEAVTTFQEGNNSFISLPPGYRKSLVLLCQLP